MRFKHIRSDMIQRKNKNNEMVLSYPDSAGITICYRPAETRQDGQWVLVGVSFCPPTAAYWNRRKANVIARSRAFDSPLQFQFEGLAEDLTERHVIQAVRTLCIEEPKWEPGDRKPLRPSRFTHRYSAALLGPGGSLLTAYLDVKVREMSQDAPRGKIIHITDPHGGKFSRDVQVSHWALRIPAWARTMLREA